MPLPSGVSWLVVGDNAHTQSISPEKERTVCQWKPHTVQSEQMRIG